MIYCDTSLIVASLTRERHTTVANGWLADHGNGRLWISPWVLTEVASALSQKLRAREIAATQRSRIVRVWSEQVRASFDIAAVTAAHFEIAARILDRGELNLRAGDALHVAIAQAEGFSIATLDDGMMAAAEAIGIEATAIHRLA